MEPLSFYRFGVQRTAPLGCEMQYRHLALICIVHIDGRRHRFCRTGKAMALTGCILNGHRQKIIVLSILHKIHILPAIKLNRPNCNVSEYSMAPDRLSSWVRPHRFVLPVILGDSYQLPVRLESCCCRLLLYPSSLAEEFSTFLDSC